MARDGAGVYTIPAGTHGVPSATISSTAYNAFTDDVATDLNLVRPIVAGGTAAATPSDARARLLTEAGSQLVADYNTFVFSPGSFYSLAGATNQPVAGHAFSGVCYSGDPLPVPPAAPANLNVVLEARDQNDTFVPGTQWIRERKAGVWGSWLNMTTVTAAQGLAPPCGRLTYVSATQLAYKPYGGNLLKINGLNYVIPNGGIAGMTNTGVYINGTAAGNLAANTDYWVFAFNNAGAVTADFRTAATHAQSTTAGNEGVEILTGNDTRTLLGMIHTTAGAQFADSATQRFVISWFNRRRRNMVNTFSVARTTSSTTGVELNTEIRCEFVIWAEDGAVFSANAIAFPSTAASATVNTAIGFDAGVERSYAQNQQETTNQPTSGGSVTIAKSSLGEGYHYATMVGWVTPGSAAGTWVSASTITGSVVG